jgi:hypothetical protein
MQERYLKKIENIYESVFECIYEEDFIEKIF